MKFSLSINRKCPSIKTLALFSLFVSSFLNLSCEKGPEPKSKINSPPVITSVILLPKNPNKENNLDLIVRGQDPDGDPLTYHYQWIKNGEEISGENENILRRGNFRKGDLIRVMVTPSDGKADGKPFLSEPIKILNSPPLIQEVNIEPKMAYASDHLKVHIRSVDIDGDAIYYTYQWEKNGVVLTEEKAEVLERGRFKKGDLIAVTVTPDDGEGKGILKKSEGITILNSPPIIVSSPPTSVEGENYIYQLEANDLDNDPISFALKSAPKGMEINKETGLIRWVVQRRDSGTHPIEIEASDQEGAKSYQRFVLNVEFR